MGTQQRRVDANDRQIRALELRKSGVSYEDIARELGYRGRDGAHRAVSAALKRTLQEPADELRRLESERLDAMLFAIAPLVRRGNLEAIDRALKIMERRAKLLGLDAPIRAISVMTDDSSYRHDVQAFHHQIAHQIVMLLGQGEVLDGEIVSSESADGAAT